jgi:hypothetical protein
MKKRPLFCKAGRYGFRRSGPAGNYLGMVIIVPSCSVLVNVKQPRSNVAFTNPSSASMEE